MPLVARARTIGALSLLREAGERHYSAEDLHLAEELARRVALAVDNARLHEEAQQARADAEAAVQTRDQVLRTVSHDLRSPLTAIQGYVYLIDAMLQDGEEDPHELKEYADNIMAATEQITYQLDELRDTVHLQAGQTLTFSWEAIELVALVRQTAAICQPIRQRRPVRIETTVAQYHCRGDSRRIERVLTNLISNAIKYSAYDQEVRVTLQDEERDGRPGVAIAVRDQGIGIPTNDLPHIFEPFQRGSNVTPKMKGSGLGLSSARYIVEQHGGTISVASEEGVGSTFTIWLPLIADGSSG